MLDFFFLPPLELVAADLFAIGADLNHLQDPLRRSVERVMAPSISRNFEFGGRPPWEPLAEGTLMQREGSTPLIRSGNLMGAATATDSWRIGNEEASLELPGDAAYGEFHQDGTRNMPARPFALIQESDGTAIEEVFLEWVAEICGQHNFNAGGADFSDFDFEAE